MTLRPEQLDGPTYIARMDDGNMYVTVNEMEGKPYEVFARYDKKEQHEIIVLITRMVSMVSMALREGVPLCVVARELKDIHSPVTNHIVPGTNNMAPSLAARIGMVLESHINGYKKAAT